MLKVQCKNFSIFSLIPLELCKRKPLAMACIGHALKLLLEKLRLRRKPCPVLQRLHTVGEEPLARSLWNVRAFDAHCSRIRHSIPLQLLRLRRSLILLYSAAADAVVAMTPLLLRRHNNNSCGVTDVQPPLGRY